MKAAPCTPLAPFDLQQKDPDLDHSAIRAKHLAVDPTAVRAGQEGDSCRNILRRAEALKRIHLRHPVDKFLRFSVEEQILGGRPRRYSVYRNRPPAQFFRVPPADVILLTSAEASASLLA